MTTIATTSQSAASAALRLSADIGQYLTFALSGEIYAFGILNVKEIIEYGMLTEVPMTPNFLRGVINLRGSVVPVVDLSARFGKGLTPINRRTGIVIVETANDDENTGRQDIGIIVDAVNEVVDIAGQDIEPPPSFGTGIRSDFISGMVKSENRFMILLNIDTVLSIEEMSALSQAVIEKPKNVGN